MLKISFSRESVEGRFVPNPGFLEDVVFADPSSISASHSHEDDTLNDQGDDVNVDGAVESDSACVVRSENGSDSNCNLDDKTDVSEQVVTELGGLKVTEDISSADVHTGDQHSLSTEDVDMLLDRCLLQALHTTVKDKDLPMPGSTLW